MNCFSKCFIYTIESCCRLLTQSCKLLPLILRVNFFPGRAEHCITIITILTSSWEAELRRMQLQSVQEAGTPWATSHINTWPQHSQRWKVSDFSIGRKTGGHKEKVLWHRKSRIGVGQKLIPYNLICSLIKTMYNSMLSSAGGVGEIHRIYFKYGNRGHLH